MGQGGNVYEWEETDFDLVNGPTDSSSARGVRGGLWFDLLQRLVVVDLELRRPDLRGQPLWFSSRECSKYPRAKYAVVSNYGLRRTIAAEESLS